MATCPVYPWITYTLGYLRPGSSSYPGGRYTGSGRSYGSPSGLPRSSSLLMTFSSMRPARSADQGSTASPSAGRLSPTLGATEPERSGRLEGGGHERVGGAEVARGLQRGLDLLGGYPGRGEPVFQLGHGQQHVAQRQARADGPLARLGDQVVRLRHAEYSGQQRGDVLGQRQALGGGEVGGHPRPVHRQAGQQLGRPARGRAGQPQQGGQGLPFGLPRAGRAVQVLLARG